MSDATPRWQLRLRNFDSAVGWLQQTVALYRTRPLSELEKAGMIQQFEIAWELGWKLLADILAAEQSPPSPWTSAAAIRAGFAAGLIDDGDGWMAAAKLRHSLAHGYDAAIRDAGLERIADSHLLLFTRLAAAMAARRDG
jgi:nucleotidyltransferase substrate binding protein (TIGR01987 family)